MTKKFRGEPSARRNDVTPGGTGSARVCRKVAWLRMKFSVIHGISAAESAVT